MAGESSRRLYLPRLSFNTEFFLIPYIILFFPPLDAL